MDTLVLLILCVCASGVQGNYHYVIAPNVIRLDSQEIFLVGILGNNRSVQLNIWFEYLEQQLLRKSVRINNPETPVEVTFKVTANDLFKNVQDGNKIRNKQKSIRLVCQDAFTNNMQSQDIPLSFKSGYLIVQTNKPLYNPEETVLVRVLAMDENLKPVKNNYLEIDLINPSNMAVGRTQFPPGSSISGFYTCAFELPPSPEIGIWTIKAKFGDMLETYATAPIEVREFVLPTFGIHIQTTPAYILPTDDTVTVKLTAMYVYGKAVDGTARLHFDIRREGEVDLSDTKTIFTPSKGQNLSSNGDAYFTIDIKKLKADRGGTFPAGGVLELSATVYESATGKEESDFDDSVKFVNAPYKFDFSTSKTSFRIGFTYLLKVYVSNVNGIKAEHLTFSVEVYYGSQMMGNLTRKTGSSGQSLDFIDSGVFRNQGTHILKVYTQGFRDYSAQLQLQPHSSEGNIVVEKIELEGHSFMRASTNMLHLKQYTEILFVVFARGKIVAHAYRPAGMILSVHLKDDIMAKLAPVGRIVAFYVDKRTATVVADSVSFDIESDKLKKKGQLTIEPASQQDFPGASSKLSVSGPSGMWVGFYVIDKALLLLNSDYIMNRDKLLKEMGTHDLGCGAGSGTTTEQILKNAGVTLLVSSGTLNKASLQRPSEGCFDMKRRRRAPAYETVLASGRSVFDSQSQYQMDIDRLPVRMLTIRRQYDTSFFFEEHMIRGSNFTQYLKFRDSITEWTIQAIGITEDDGPYIAESKDVKAFKGFFVQVDLPYKVTRKELFNVKVTVFNYVDTEKTAKVYLKGVEKLCYGTTPGQHSPPQSLTLPTNSAKSLTFGVIALEAGTYPITVSALVVDEHMPYVDIVEKQLYVVNEGIQVRETITVCLDPADESKTCIDSPEVTRHATLIRGIRPSATMTVSLNLPVSALRGSGSANAYLSTNMMSKAVDTVINGVGDMIREPSGCCQQTFYSTVPVVAGLYYLKQTGLLTDQQKQRGHRFLTKGIEKVSSSSCINADGSYNPMYFPSPGLWVTAFVVRIMCQAEKVLPGSFGSSRIQLMLGYLARQNRDGYGNFWDPNPIYSSNSKDVGSYLTAYVLATMRECQERTQDIQNSTRDSVAALERLSDKTLRANPNLLAISTYALALSNSSQKERFFTILRDIKTEDIGRMYWSTSSGIASAADTVETTSYALLSFLQFDDMKSSQKIVAWLTQNVQGSGYWTTTKDSPVAFQAVAAFSVRNYIPEVDLDTSLESGDGKWVKTIHLSNQNTVLNTLIPNLPVANGDKLKVTVTGVGTGILKIDLFYSRLATKEEICPFKISPITIKDVITEVADNEEFRLLKPESPCDVCGYCPEPRDVNVTIALRRRPKLQSQWEGPVRKCVQFSVRTMARDYEAGMSIVEVNLETGVSVVESDLKRLQSNITVIPLYEMPKDGKGFIIFYLTKVTGRPINFIFRLKDDFSGNETTRPGASIRVYDYYNPEKSCMKQYTTNPNIANIVAMACEGSDQWKCVQINEVRIELVNGPNDHSGRVEIVIGTERGTVCDDNWDDNDAKVICKMLGYGGGKALNNSHFGQGSSSILLDDVQCDGTESSIMACRHSGLGFHDCRHHEDAAVICSPKNTCGRRPLVDYLRKKRNLRIRGGGIASQGFYPWQAGVRMQTWSSILRTYSFELTCGGIILNDRWILSAAHCFWTRDKDDIKVYTGDHDLLKTDTFEEQFELEYLIKHPNYTYPSYDYDIALMKVKLNNGSGIQFNDEVQPACLPDARMHYETGLMCHISGWGISSNYSLKGPTLLHAAEVPLIDDEVCTRQYINNTQKITPNMVCAGYMEGGIDACSGDSGGPLVCSVEGIYYVMGVTSWGRKCALPNYPGVYAKVAAFQSWIDNTIASQP